MYGKCFVQQKKVSFEFVDKLWTGQNKVNAALAYKQTLFIFHQRAISVYTWDKVKALFGGYFNTCVCWNMVGNCSNGVAAVLPISELLPRTEIYYFILCV